ncbi:MAG: precorrin-8X methylmutase [Oscillospiraceae bacterium]|nr:precorrin-8X methylmutase [Oscillospiraceae bacterium]
MNTAPEHVLPRDIEKRSFEIISAELGDTGFNADEESVLKRVIHTTADFDYAHNLCFSPGAVQKGLDALGRGIPIITDTKMAWSGINKAALAQLGAQALCFMGDADVAEAARLGGTTRSAACMDKAARTHPNAVLAIGNAPTALMRLHELVLSGQMNPALIIGVPVGFVNVVQSKELIMTLGVPYIVAKGRKGGSTVAAAVCNALVYLSLQKPASSINRILPGTKMELSAPRDGEI